LFSERGFKFLVDANNVLPEFFEMLFH
jgi:hypothetical protein